jgi:hypothetical protein
MVIDNWSPSDIGYTVKFYCTSHEDFFEMSPIAPTRCPVCFADARFILGPFSVREVDLNKAKAEYYKSKKYKSTRR